VADAPRGPFVVRGTPHPLLELPPATLRLLGVNVPAGGGGYFRLFPLWVLRAALVQARRSGPPAVAVLYFHPWEFDPEQARLPLSRLGRFRTYVGLSRTRGRLARLLAGSPFTRAADAAARLLPRLASLPSFPLPASAPGRMR
jgi:hypothetical protein